MVYYGFMTSLYLVLRKKLCQDVVYVLVKCKLSLCALVIFLVTEIQSFIIVMVYGAKIQ